MQQEWNVEHQAGQCSVTGTGFEEGEEFFSVLFEDGDSFRRADYSIDAWKGPPEGSFCHFKSRVPVKQKKKRLFVDNEVLINFFTRLSEEEEPVRIQFRFVLALILMRKRLLRYDSSAVEDGREVWQMTLLSEKSSHEVVNPQLSDDQIDGVSEQLGAVLHGDVGQWPGDTDGANAAVDLPESSGDDV